MPRIIAFADANGVIGFASDCPNHALGFAEGPREIVERIVTEHADKVADLLRIPAFGGATDNIAGLIAFGARIRTACARAVRAAALAGPDLDAQREFAASTAYEEFEFPAQVDSDSGWERQVPGNEWRRQVYLVSEVPGAPTIRGVFTLVFAADAARIDSAGFTPC